MAWPLLASAAAARARCTASAPRCGTRQGLSLIVYRCWPRLMPCYSRNEGKQTLNALDDEESTIWLSFAWGVRPTDHRGRPGHRQLAWRGGLLSGQSTRPLPPPYRYSIILSSNPLERSVPVHIHHIYQVSQPAHANPVYRGTFIHIHILHPPTPTSHPMNPST